ncbi:hypothetical protein Tco_0336848 [Tanacetum coccineum]
MGDASTRPMNPFLHSLTQDLPQQSENKAPIEPTIPSLNPNLHQNNTQPNPLIERENIHREVQNLQTFHQNIEEEIQNAQHVQDNLIPPTSITHVHLPPPFPPTTTPIQTPLFNPSFPPPSVYGPIDQTLWLESHPKPQEHSCLHCEKTEAMINNFKTKTRFMLNHILERINNISNRLPRKDH